MKSTDKFRDIGPKAYILFYATPKGEHHCRKNRIKTKQRTRFCVNKGGKIQKLEEIKKGEHHCRKRGTSLSQKKIQMQMQSGI